MDLWILVVDDNSPDGTGQLADSLKNQYPKLKIIHRPKKEGLGPAYRAGFSLALEENFDRIVTMDADFSHDPRYLPALLEGIDHADIAVGSRYLRGISVVNWSLKRLILSYFANRYVQWVTRLPVRDCTSGFMAFRSDVLRKIPWKETFSQSYSFLVELKYLTRRFGFRLVEKPIIFVERKKGVTKISPFTLFEAVGAPWRMVLKSRSELR
jgi:dolichol-phosphate mannosyltransferase